MANLSNDRTRAFGGDVLRIVTVVALGSVLLGCPNPQTYGTPRTTPAGKISHTLAAEVLHASTTTTTPAVSSPTPGIQSSPERSETISVTAPLLPTYQIRVGLGDRVDIGARVANLSSLGADVKWNFVKSESVDLAIDPGLQLMFLSSGSSTSSGDTRTSVFIMYGHLPLLLGLNFGESASLVVSGGLVAAYANATVGGDQGTMATGAGGSVGGRGGIGMDFRMSKKFALHPEVTAMKFSNDNLSTMILFGLGFNFGSLPSYAPGSEDDIYEDETAPKPAVAPASAPAPVAEPPPSGGI